MLFAPLPVHFPRRTILLAVIGLGLLPVARAGAQLVDTSPFLGAGSASGPNGGPDSTALELRGIMSTPAGTRYCIYDPVKKAGAWVGLNERGSSFMIKSADPGHEAVTVQSEGRTMRLVLHAAKVAALGAGAPGAPPGAGGPPNAAPAAPKPSPADEAARLAAVADAVRARRQMREQAAQGGQGAATPTAAAPAGHARTP